MVITCLIEPVAPNTDASVPSGAACSSASSETVSVGSAALPSLSPASSALRSPAAGSSDAVSGANADVSLLMPAACAFSAIAKTGSVANIMPSTRSILSSLFFIVFVPISLK